MKYEFIKVDEDTTKLKYKDKEFEFKRNIKLISEMQSLIMKSRIKAIQDLAKEGQSVKDLTIERKENGKTYYDNSNRKELEAIYQQQAILDFFDNKCIEMSGMGLSELMSDIGLINEDDIEKFAQEFMQHLTGNTPSK